MLTRLKVNGFKNLVDVDVRFGPFTCIAGANGVGKSNLFDAIRFLSLLADNTLIDAALKLRGPNGRTRDIRSLFHPSTDEMSFEAEMIIPRYGKDDLGQTFEAESTTVHYNLVLTYHPERKLDLTSEMLFISFENFVLFEKSAAWLESAVIPAPRIWSDRSLIEFDGKDLRIGEKPHSTYTQPIPRTFLSSRRELEGQPVKLFARQEMQSWRVFQLEPSALTGLDQVKYNAQIQPNGADLTATLYRIARTSGDPERIYTTLRNRLATLVPDIREISIDYNEGRDEVGLRFKDSSGTEFPARVLSDGTLRLLALAVMEIDRQLQGVICIEEPENGLHPAYLPAMLRLLQDIAVDTDYPIDETNPLRQVIITTHSPSLVQQLPDDALLIAKSLNLLSAGQWSKRIVFEYLSDTWRDQAPEGTHSMSRGDLLTYLNPVVYEFENGKRLIDRDDLQPLLPWTKEKP